MSGLQPTHLGSLKSRTRRQGMSSSPSSIGVSTSFGTILCEGGGTDERSQLAGPREAHPSASGRQQESFSLVAQDDAAAGDGLDLEFAFDHIALHVAVVLDVDQSFGWVRGVGH